jgi:colicin V production protein
MLGFLTIVIMLVLAWVYWLEGLFTACVMCWNVLLAGLIAFNFWEPLANLMDPTLGGYEDALCLVVIFCLVLGALKALTNQLAHTEIEFVPQLQRPGAALAGLLTGYLVSGFLVCVLQTLPYHEHFLGFDARCEPDNQPVRRLLPPDRVWLALMHREGAAAFSTGGPTFDPDGSFELRFARYRRYQDNGESLPYDGAFDPALPLPAAPSPSP